LPSVDCEKYRGWNCLPKTIWERNSPWHMKKDIIDTMLLKHILAITNIIINENDNKINSDLTRCRKLFSNTVLSYDAAKKWVMVSSLMTLLDHTQRCNTVDRTPLDKWSVHLR
jgi:hypothetical protein